MDISRRAFIVTTAAGVFAGRYLFGRPDEGAVPVVRFGMVTDLHYADINPDPAPCGVVGRRFYRESLRKLGEAIEVFNTRSLDFAIELGDFKDLTRDREGTLKCLDAIEACFAKFNGPRYHVAGNHDFDCLPNREFFEHIPNDGRVVPEGYYSFVRGGVKFIVLNACFDSKLKPYSCNNPWNDANMPPEELAWLEKELASAKGNVIVFCHQRLEDSAERQHIVKNADAVRAILEKSGKVKGVITGHQHRGGFCVLNGIPYYSLRALVCDSGEGANSFAEVAVYPSGAFTVTGWRRAQSYGAKGEFPERGVIACRTVAAAKEAEMVDFGTETNVAELEAHLAPFPKAGRFLKIDCNTADVAIAAAELLRRTGRLAGAFLMMDSRADLVAVKAKCPWVKTGLVLNADAGAAKSWTEDEAWRKLRDAAKIGVEFVQILSNCHCTPDQMRFLHDHAIRTACFAANGEKSMQAIAAEGHDFIFTDHKQKGACS